MKRRTVLATIGATTVATAGCLSDAGDRPNDDNGTSTDGTETDDPGTADPKGTTTAGDETRPTPDDTFADVACPSFSESADRTVCWHTADLDAEPIYLDANPDVFEPTPGDDSVESVEFVLYNDSAAGFGLNPYAWAIKRRTEDGWAHVAPEEWVEPWYTVDSGETYTWRLSMTERTQAMAERTMAITEDLDDGIYAFQITGIADEQSDDPTHVECLALFEVDRQE
ncbi:hypothetical protein [Halorientalis salina]|uniref:hypothetical protein n=1 Tax=Halorientalis salina TaxID=2932266 RepID=UPI0010AD4AD2|nr:hypothetical protein [Halorientalis salina]